MWQRRIKTRFALWAAFSFALFVAAGCINLVPEGKTVPYWSLWTILLTGSYGCSTGEFVLILGMWSLMIAVPAVILGWVAQAILSAAMSKPGHAS